MNVCACCADIAEWRLNPEDLYVLGSRREGEEGVSECGVAVLLQCCAVLANY